MDLIPFRMFLAGTLRCYTSYKFMDARLTKTNPVLSRVFAPFISSTRPYEFPK